MNQPLHDLAVRSNYWISINLIIIAIIIVIGLLFDNLLYSYATISLVLLLIQKVLILIALFSFLMVIRFTIKASKIFKAQFSLASIVYFPIALGLYYVYHQNTSCWAVCFDPGIVYLGLSFVFYVLVIIASAYFQNRRVIKSAE